MIEFILSLEINESKMSLKYKKYKNKYIKKIDSLAY